MALLALLRSTATYCQAGAGCPEGGQGLATFAYHRAVLERAMEAPGEVPSSVTLSLTSSGSEERLVFRRSSSGYEVLRGVPKKNVYDELVERDRSCLLAPNPWVEAKKIDVVWEVQKLTREAFRTLHGRFIQAASALLGNEARRSTRTDLATDVAIHFRQFVVTLADGEQRIQVTVIDSPTDPCARWARGAYKLAESTLGKKQKGIGTDN